MSSVSSTMRDSSMRRAAVSAAAAAAGCAESSAEYSTPKMGFTANT